LAEERRHGRQKNMKVIGSQTSMMEYEQQNDDYGDRYAE
jgi:hypothetical protein